MVLKITKFAKNDMKVISERISILRKDNLLSIVILPTTDRKKLVLLFLWLMAWTVCGIIVFMNYFRITDTDAKLFLIIYLSFWAYFEFNITRTFIWKKFGREKIWIQDGILNYQKEINRKGRIKEYDLNLLTPLRVVELRGTSLADTINQSFWVRGGERIEFNTQAKTTRFGMQISDKEAAEVVKEINGFVKKLQPVKP
jgi:hypothetical protein